jgi:hypothetical protein
VKQLRVDLDLILPGYLEGASLLLDNAVNGITTDI